MSFYKNPRILVDIDGVCLNWLDGFIRYMRHQGFVNLREHVKHDELGYRFGINHEECDNHIRTFNGGHWEFGTLPPEEGAVNGIRYLNEKMGYRFVGITSCTTSPTTISLRKANLYNVFGDVFDAVHCVDHGKSKNTHLADYEPTFWVEDKTVNAEAGLQYGHQCILMNRLYNSNDKIDSQIKRCYSWDEVILTIKNNQ